MPETITTGQGRQPGSARRPRRRRHPAAVGKILTAGFSTAGTLAVVTALTLTTRPSPRSQAVASLPVATTATAPQAATTAVAAPRAAAVVTATPPPIAPHVTVTAPHVTVTAPHVTATAPHVTVTAPPARRVVAPAPITASRGS
ncbi:MAG: hypothetical protein U0V73_08315 [Acidimicrobiia bacterium]